MSDDDRPPFYPYARKRPPPAHGIKVKKTGTTWWGVRWIEALERLSRRYTNRLSRGKTYARAGRTHDLVVAPGVVRARVTGTRPAPYEVTIELSTLADSAWKQAVAKMAERAEFAAELLAGQMPQRIDEAFLAAGASLFPLHDADLTTSCSCPDTANPCKHVAATHYVLGEAFDRDPFLLFELRGRSKDQVLSALRAARSAESSPTRQRGQAIDTPSAKLRLGKLRVDDYDKPAKELPALELSFQEPVVHGAILRQLGTPAEWNQKESPASLLEPLVRAAAEKARRMALAEPTTEAELVDSRKDEPTSAAPRNPRRPGRASRRQRAK